MPHHAFLSTTLWHPTRAIVVALILLASTGVPALAERPSAMKLFPEETVLFVRMANAHEFGQRLRDTAIGRMIRDPQLQPFVEQLYGDVGRIYAEEAEARVGLSWNDLQNLPQGEVALGLVTRPDRRPAILVLIDQGEAPSVAERLLDRALTLATERGAEITKETIAGIEVTVVRDADRPNRMFGVFERENTLVAATDPDVLRNVLWHWDGGGQREDSSYQFSNNRDDASASDNANGAEETDEFVPSRTLAENDRFLTIARHCRRPQDPPPHLLFFLDPIELARGVGRNRGGVQFVMGLLPALGLDGLLGIGGTLTYSSQQYDDVIQMHILLENPRAGVLQLPAFQDGDTTPPPFVPHAIETYRGTNVNFRTTYDRIVSLIETYRPQGSMEKFVQDRISKPLGIDFPTEVIDNLTGRITWITGYDKPARLQSRQHVFAAELKDESAASESLKAVMEKYPDLFIERQFGNVTYHAILSERLRQMDEDERPVHPFVAIMDRHFFIGGSTQLFEQCIAARDGTLPRLADSEDYARTREMLGQETTNVAPALLTISRAEEPVRQWYELLLSDQTRTMIDENKQDQPFLAALAAALDAHQLPPFEVLAPYFAPGGAILYDTDTGYHAIRFTLRNSPPR